MKYIMIYVLMIVPLVQVHQGVMMMSCIIHDLNMHPHTMHPIKFMCNPCWKTKNKVAGKLYQNGSYGNKCSL